MQSISKVSAGSLNAAIALLTILARAQQGTAHKGLLTMPARSIISVKASDDRP